MRNFISSLWSVEKGNLLVTMIFLQIADLLSTYWFFKFAGLREGNPFLSLANGTPNFEAIVIFKFFGVWMSAYLLMFARRLWLFRVLLMLYVGVFFWNVWHIWRVVHG